MAKEEVKNATELSVENIEEKLKAGAIVTEEIAKAAAEEIAKKRKEELTDRLIKGMKKSDYTRKKILISMKHTKKVSNIKLEYLKKFSAIDDDLKAGKISIDEYDKKIKEEYATANKLVRETDLWRDEQNKILDNQYPEARFSWNYDNLVLS